MMPSASSKKRSGPEDSGVDGEPSSPVPPVIGVEEVDGQDGGTVNPGEVAHQAGASFFCVLGLRRVTTALCWCGGCWGMSIGHGGGCELFGDQRPETDCFGLALE